MEKEIWLPVIGYEWLYEVSNLGWVRSLDNILPHKQWPYLNKWRTLKPDKQKNWYLRVTLCNRWKIKRWLVHRLVALVFIPNTENKSQTNHKNGIKTDNRLENLERITQAENTKHSYDVLLQKKSRAWLWKTWIKHHSSKKIWQYTLDGEFIKLWYWAMDISRNMWCWQWNIHACCTWTQKTCYGFIWKYI